MEFARPNLSPDVISLSIKRTIEEKKIAGDTDGPGTRTACLMSVQRTAVQAAGVEKLSDWDFTWTQEVGVGDGRWQVSTRTLLSVQVSEDFVNESHAGTHTRRGQGESIHRQVQSS
jgi:hypothetical protein